MIISQISYIIMGAVDNIMIAKVGVDELAIAAFCNNVFAILVVTQMGLASAVSPLVANAVGANDPHKVGKLFRHSLILLLICSILLSAVMFFLGLNIEWFKQEEIINIRLWEYYPWLIANLPLIAIQQAHKQFYDGIEESVTPMKFLYLSIPLNIFLNWIFIYGNWGAPALGLHGAGLATILSRAIIIMLLVYRTHGRGRYQSLYALSFQNFKFESPICKMILILGIPSSFQYLFEVGAFSAAGISAGQLGKLEIAAHQIAINIASLPFMAALGWSFATSIKIGSALGEKDIEKCRRLGLNSLIVVALYMCVTSAIIILTKDISPLIYLDNQEIIGLVSGVLIIVGLFQVADGLQAVALGMLRGLQDVRVPTVITFMAYWLLAIPFGRYLAFETDWHLKGIWIGLLVGLYISAFFLLLRFHQITSKKIKELAN